MIIVCLFIVMPPSVDGFDIPVITLGGDSFSNPELPGMSSGPGGPTTSPGGEGDFGGGFTGDVTVAVY